MDLNPRGPMVYRFEPNPKKALSKAYLKKPVDRADLERFRDELLGLYARRDPTESEEHLKIQMADFLKATLYRSGFLVNTKASVDLTITEAGRTKVLFEVKHPDNKPEMMSAEKPNAKALHQLLLYFLRERISGKNLDLKHLVVTNVDEWFVFDAKEFEEVATKDKELVRKFQEFEARDLLFSQTADFYGHIAKPWFEAHHAAIAATVFSLRDLARSLADDPNNLEALVPIYKFLSPAHLLRESFQNDSNTLDKNFYGELLYWMGLEEARAGSKTVIRRPAAPQAGSLMELILDRLKIDSRGVREEDRWEVALELALLWVNRLIFLKLLESQLMTYHNRERHYRFLGPNDIEDFGDLYNLFFGVLAIRRQERSPQHFHRWARVPYMNSRLFELSHRETAVFSINQLDNNVRLVPPTKTVLKKSDGTRDGSPRKTLDYVLSFLDAYDFSSEGTGEIQETRKTLINASVLGLIFEKINGYKEGSFFTPGYITQYMARQTVHSAILTKFRQIKAWDCADLTALHNRIEPDTIGEANQIINSLKIVDPAVGSGHFLVSVLNELIAVKSDLGILTDKDGKRLRDYRILVENDELFVEDADGESVIYQHPFGLGDRQRVWETLFREKKTLIENCLFGVDINPNSVQICKLRLWIELLKHSYYTSGSGFQDLETLPNLDIKIREGNSLISRYALDVGLEKIGAREPGLMTEFLRLVGEYQKTLDKAAKNDIEVHIETIKNKIRADLDESRPLKRKREILKDELDALAHQDLFGLTEAEKENRDKLTKPLADQLAGIEAQLDDEARNPIYRNSFEWRFEFPEVLDPVSGDFIGFDVVIGNPPYIRIQELRVNDAQAVQFYSHTFRSGIARNYDSYVLFVERSLQLLSKDGVAILIVPNKFMQQEYGAAIRDLLTSGNHVQSIVDFGDFQIFPEATIYTCILGLSQSGNPSFLFTRSPTGLADPVFTSLPSETLSGGPWVITTGSERSLLSNLWQMPRLGGAAYRIFVGIQTSADKVFILAIKEEREETIVAWSEALQTEVEIERIWLRHIVSGADVKRFIPPAFRQVVLFPYLVTDSGILLAKIADIARTSPLTAQYLVRNEDVLRRREDGRLNDENWHGYIYLKNMALQSSPKICIPRLVQRIQAIWDEDGQWCLDNVDVGGLLLKPEFSGHEPLMLGILNSKLLSWYLSKVSTPFRGGYYSCNRQYLEQLPIPASILPAPRRESYSISLPGEASQIESLVTRILAAKKADPAADTLALEVEIDQLVYQLYGLTEDEIAFVEGRD